MTSQYNDLIIIIIIMEMNFDNFNENGRICIYSSMLTRNACFVYNASVNDNKIRKAEHFKTMHKDNIPATAKYAQR
jgi:hypothetical protein